MDFLNEKGLDVTPNVNFLATLRNSGYNNYSAIADIIDNSLDTNVNSKNVKIKIKKIDYRIVDNTLKYGLTYYRLTQIDYDGNYEVFNNMIRAVDKLSNRNVVKITNTIGQNIDEYYEGVIIIYYDDNTFEKKYNKKVD